MFCVMFLQSCLLFYFLPDAMITFFEGFAWILNHSHTMADYFTVLMGTRSSDAQHFLCLQWSRGASWKAICVEFEVSHCGFTVLCITFSRATVWFWKAYCTFSLCASSLYSSTTHLSECTLHCNISAAWTVLHYCNRNLSEATSIMHNTCYRPGVNYSVSPRRV